MTKSIVLFGIVASFVKFEIMGHAVRSKPIGIELLEAYPKCMRIFQKARWFPFLQRFQGHEKQVTKDFAKMFDGTKV
jgi:hypothetical protein